jgi:hypothetical protein
LAGGFDPGLPPEDFPELDGIVGLDFETRDPKMNSIGPGWAWANLEDGTKLDTQFGYPVGVAIAWKGGMEIEVLAEKEPHKIFRYTIDPLVGFRSYLGRDLGYALKLPESVHGELTKFCQNLIRAYLESDASLVEINPLVLTADNHLVALDAKNKVDLINGIR